MAQKSRQEVNSMPKANNTIIWNATYANKVAKGSDYETKLQLEQSVCINMVNIMAKLDQFIALQNKLKDMFMTVYLQTASSRAAPKKK